MAQFERGDKVDIYEGTRQWASGTISNYADTSTGLTFLVVLDDGKPIYCRENQMKPATKSLPDTETKVKSLRAKYSSKGINNGSEDARTFARRVLLSKYPDERWNIDEFIKQSAMSPDDYVEDRDVIEQYAEYCD